VPASQLSFSRVGVGIVLLAPAGLILGLALRSGGFFPASTGIAAVAVLLLLVVRATSAGTPFAGVGTGLAVAAIALIAFATWTLLSSSWSGSAARASLEYDRVLLYAAVLVLTGAIGRSPRRARLLLVGMTVSSGGLCVAAVATWLMPDVLHAGQDYSRERLGWPTSYWNATGLMAALALVFSLSLSCSASERPAVRAAAAALAPCATAALIFTVSRGAVAVAALGAVVAVAAIRSSATPGGLAAVLPAIGVAVAVSLHVHGINTHTPSDSAVAAGHRTAIGLAALALAAAGLRTLLTRVDLRMPALGARIAPQTRRLAVGAAVLALLAAFVGAGGVERVRAAGKEFAAPESQSVAGDLPAGQRLVRFGNNGRIDQWRVAFDHGFREHPVHGIGAGTYATLWTRYAPPSDDPRRVLDAHSLYIEQLGEVGLVGTAFLVVAIGSILVASVRRARGPHREAWAALLAATVMWAVHAGVDWDWEMPAVTAWVFAAGGLALSMPPDPRRTASRGIRLGVGLGCLILTVAPALAWRSQVRLVRAVDALTRGDCLTAERAALDANAAMGSRSDPFEVVSYCEAGAERYGPALSAIRAAERRDPENWELPYAEALIRAVAGLDPRPAARAALARYPASPLTRAAARAFTRGGSAAWRRFALRAPLPIPPRKSRH
jgi:hypothetical protein